MTLPFPHPPNCRCVPCVRARVHTKAGEDIKSVGKMFLDLFAGAPGDLEKTIEAGVDAQAKAEGRPPPSKAQTSAPKAETGAAAASSAAAACCFLLEQPAGWCCGKCHGFNAKALRVCRHCEHVRCPKLAADPEAKRPGEGMPILDVEGHETGGRK